jgi:uncharacterized membrane protein
MHLHAMVLVVFRWMHIAAACAAVGGVLFMRVIVPIGLKELDPETREATFLRLRWVFKMVIHTCILLLLLSGIYNSMGNWQAYNEVPSLAQPLWGTHVLLGLVIFALLLWLLAPKTPPAGYARWMMVNLILMAATLAVAAGLKYVRDNRAALKQLHASADFENEIHFNGGIEREAIGSDGGAGVLAGVAEDGDEEFTGAVGDFGLVGKVVVGLNENTDADHADEPVPVAGEFAAGDGQAVGGTLGGGLLGLFERNG